MNKLKILVSVGRYRNGIASGINTVVREIVKRLEKNHEIIILGYRGIFENSKRIDYTENGSKIIRVGPAVSIPKTNLSFFHYILLKKFWLHKLVKSFSPDVIYAHNRLDILAANSINLPVVGHIHSIYTKYFLEQDKKRFWMPEFYWNWYWNFIKDLEFKALSECDQLITYSEFLADLARNRGAKNLVVIPNGIDSSKFSEKGKKHIFPKKPAITFCGRIELVKGIEYLIKAANYLPSVYFYLIGNSIHKFKYPNNVYLLGPVDHDELPIYLRSSDIYLHPVIRDGFEISIMEALSCGIPAITTIGHERECVYKNSVYYIRTKNHEDIVKAIKELMNDDNLRKKLIKRGKKLSQYYEWDNIVTNIEKILINSTMNINDI